MCDNDSCGCKPTEGKDAEAEGGGCSPAEGLDFSSLKPETPLRGGAAVKDSCGCAPVKEACCEPAPASAAAGESCCGPAPDSSADPMERPGVKVWGFVAQWLDTPIGKVPKVCHEITRYDMLGRWAMRWGLGRESYRIAPGVYAFGNPGRNAPVLVTCNYKMTFDHLRKSWEGLDAWVLVLETQGVNVWCAAGKGTFGTGELINRLKLSRVGELVDHKELILPQLGAPGVSGFEVKKATGFAVRFGPVRAEDVKAYLAADKTATAEMRQVTFPIMERFALTPVELMAMRKNTLWALLIALVVSGIGPSIWSITAAFGRGSELFGAYMVGLGAGAVLCPVLLPWTPGRMFSTKGALVGAITSIAAVIFFGGAMNWLETLAFVGVASSVAAFLALNFTGATTFTSPTGVELEMRKLIPWQAGGAGVSLVLWVLAAFIG